MKSNKHEVTSNTNGKLLMHEISTRPKLLQVFDNRIQDNSQFSALLNNIVDSQERCPPHNIAASCFQQRLIFGRVALAILLNLPFDTNDN